MRSKYARLNRLIEEGYVVLDITSDEWRIEARLQRGRFDRAVIEFTREDAARLLFEEDPGSRRPPRGPRPPSRFLVTRPLR